jgi:DNA-binding MarR family transcriptional regulator
MASLNGAAPEGNSEEATTRRPSADRVAAARALYAARRRRDKLFGPVDIFGEPSWDMLLDLYVAAGGGRELAVSSLCIGSVVPPTTALRYIALLEKLGFIHSIPDPADGRRRFLHLTDKAMDLLDSYF